MTPPVAILTDVTRCTGCEQCVAACKSENGLGDDRPWPGQRAVDDLSSTRFTTILRRPGNNFVRQQCRHCLEPACVSACIVGALEKRSDGPVTYDSDKCMGCRYCMTACPYGIPRYDWDQAAPYVRKCTFCYDRVQQGSQPACTEACPEKATIFGPRVEMLAEAHRRVEADRTKYVQEVYGEREVGGTSVLYISSIPLGFLGWQDHLGEQALPDLTWASLKKVPGVILGMGGLMAGTYWLIGRRMKLAAEQAAAVAATDDSDSSVTAAHDGDSDHE